jgi:hypothetical protein
MVLSSLIARARSPNRPATDRQCHNQQADRWGQLSAAFRPFQDVM